MRKLAMFVAGTFLVSTAGAFAEDAVPGVPTEIKKESKPQRSSRHRKKKHRHHHHHHHHEHSGASETHGGPFTDVPRGHWAYDAVQKAAEAGILQGWNNRFNGHKVVNRYQMAVVVARMLDRVGVLRQGGKVITAEDIANLESLVIEFADELALLNVKVSTLEDTVASLKKDVDLIKADLRGVGARAGITGTVDARFVFTDDTSSGYRYGPFVSGLLAPNPSATSSVVRYNGQAVSGDGNPVLGVPGLTGPNTFDSREFFTVANFAINIDREFDPHTHFHAQVNINAEGSLDSPGATLDGLGNIGPLGAPPYFFPAPAGAVNTNLGAPLAGRGSSFTVSNVLVNELYVVFDDWFTSGVNGRLGIYALPMNTEVNGPSRTYLWTLTPSIANSKWESIRPVGLDIFQHNDRDSWTFYVGFFTPGDTQNGILRSGTLLSQNQGIFLINNALFQNGQTDNVPTGSAVGRFPTPLADAAMTDAARGIDGQTLNNDDIGFYAQVGQHPTCKDHRGFSWNVAYFDRNGNIHRGLDGSPSLTDWNAWQIFVSHQWSDVLLMAQYYNSTSENYSFADLGAGTGVIVDGRRIFSTPFANFFGEDTRSDSFMALANWQFCRRGSATIRYEDAEDRTGAAKIEAEVWTLAFNWRTSDHGWLQLEFIAPETKTRSENGVGNTLDINDDLFQVNYKMNW